MFPDDRLRVLIAGGGVAALEAALALRHDAADRVQIELLAPEEHFTYRPLAVAEPFRVGEVRTFPLAAIAEAAGAALRHGALAVVDPEAHQAETDAGDQLEYDLLVLAYGAEAVAAVPGALAFRGPQDGDALAAILADARQGHGRRIVFAVPTGATWPLPLYELALLTEWHLVEYGVGGYEVTIVTPENGALTLFGEEASRSMRELLAIRGITLRTDAPSVAFENGRLAVVGGDPIAADHAVALPRLVGRPVEGIPHNREGFVEIDAYCGVRGLDDECGRRHDELPGEAGGIATQMADAAASAFAVRAGVPVAQQPFRPVIRGLLLTGGVPRYLRAEATGRGSTIDAEPLWWPPAKIVGRHLAPFLAERAGIREAPPRAGKDEGVEINVELEFEAGEVRPLG